MEQIYQIYDRIFKRIFALSNLAIINMINGLFGTNHPTDSRVTYPNKEFVNQLLKDRLADVIITVNERFTYHIEAQLKKDNNIVLRAFEYGFQYAVENAEDKTHLIFPEPIIIYLSKESDIPDKSILVLDFGEQGIFEYQVKNFVYLDHDIVEVNQKKMITLIPFQLLRLKNIISKSPTRENFKRLQVLLENDIIDSIKANLKLGNITQEDANQLLELTKILYAYLYDHYYEIGGCEDMKPLLDGAIELPLDKYRIRIDKLQEECARAEKERAKAEEGRIRAEEERAKVEKEIALLKQKLQELQK